MTSQQPRTVVKISGPTDIVGTVPHLLGFQPQESVVIVCLEGERRRTGFTMRYDLMDERHDQLIAAELAGRAAHAGASALLAVIYTEASEDEAGGLPRSGLVEAIVTATEGRGMDVPEALLVRTGRWWSYAPVDAASPRQGELLPDPHAGAGGRFAAEAALLGHALLGSREELEASVQGPVALSLVGAEQAFARGTATLVQEWAQDGTEAAAERTVRLVEELLTAYRHGRLDLSDDDVARVSLGLSDVQARDDVMSLHSPDPEAYLGLLSALARRTPDHHAAPICGVLAWVAYSYGNGALTKIGRAHV